MADRPLLFDDTGHRHWTALQAAGCADATVVGMAAAPERTGYWIAQSDGGVFAYDSAAFRGSAAGWGAG